MGSRAAGGVDGLLGPVEKIIAKGPKTHQYYFASWKMRDKVANKYIGPPRMMTREAATAKARKLKAEALAVDRSGRNIKKGTRKLVNYI